MDSKVAGLSLVRLTWPASDVMFMFRVKARLTYMLQTTLYLEKAVDSSSFALTVWTPFTGIVVKGDFHWGSTITVENAF